ncbi:MAG: ParB N-terminal domain-containing protein [Candidatus Bathyarchaeia archaeon]
MVKRFSTTPIRRLDGITYWVIEDSDGIYDFINKEIRREWEADARFECRNPEQDLWLRTLQKRKWSLKILEVSHIKLNPDIMSYVDGKKGYNFSEALAIRSNELKHSIERYGLVIWPVIVRKEDSMLVDGYCRYTALKAMNVRRIYAYVGTL